MTASGSLADVVVFAGPSLSAREAAELGAIDCRPPAKRGDIRCAAEQGVRRIVLIDGEMVYNAPPTPYEIRDALRNGTQIVGASSLGALRAVELFDEGMQGFGWVYGAFLSRRVDADDELLSILDPETHVQLTIPLVNVRYGLLKLARTECVSARAVERLMLQLASIHFSERTRDNVIRLGRSVLGPLTPQLEQALSGHFNIKRLDAIACLRCALSGGLWNFD